MNRIIIIIVSLIMSLPVYSLGRVVSYDEIRAALFGTIRKISICGDYSDKDTVGEIRMIESYAYGGSMIFVDTIKLGQSGLEVLRGTSVEETNNDHYELSIEQLLCEDQGNNKVKIRGFVNGSGHEESTKYTFTIIYNALNGTYKYTEESGKRKQADMK